MATVLQWSLLTFPVQSCAALQLCICSLYSNIFLFPIIFLVKEGLYDAIINQTVFTLDMFQTGSKNISMIDFSETYLCA